MKYALVHNQFKSISSISNREITHYTSDIFTQIEITDADAEKINQIPRILCYYIDGQVLTRDEKRAADVLARAEKIAADKLARETPTAKLTRLLSLGHTVGGVTYGITPNDQNQWVSALTVLGNAKILNAFNEATTPVQSVLGPLLDINGNPVDSMTVLEFRGVMAQLGIRVGEIRTECL